MATKFLTNVTHNGVLFKQGDIIAETLDANESMLSRGLVEATDEAPTHRSDEGDTSGRALPLDPAATPAEPSQEEIDADRAKQEAAIKEQEAEAARRAAEQVKASAPEAPAHQPTPAEIAAEADQIK